MDIIKNKTEFDSRLSKLHDHFKQVIDDTKFKWSNINSILMLEIRFNWTTESSNSNYQINSEHVKDFFPILQMTDAFPHWRLSMPALISNSVLSNFAKPPNSNTWLDAHISYRHKIQNSYPYLQLTLEDDLRLLKNSLKENDQIYFLKEQNSTNYFVFATKSKLFPEESILIIDPTKTSIDKTQFELEDIEEKSIMTNDSDVKNIILYGPPGTGKTHNAINHALSIITGKNVNEYIEAEKANSDNRKKAKSEFDFFVNKGQIQFVTFHQSYSYEEFVEGIKPTVNVNGEIEYNIKDGVFKKLCLEANKKNKYDFEEIFDNFFTELNDAKSIDLKTSKKKKDFKVYIDDNGNIYAKTTNSKSLIKKEAIRNYLEKDLLPDWWNSYIRSVGDYLKTKYEANIESINNSEKKFVLIIDEINRGNISKIFGELITVIEESKRMGKLEELKLKLTYSGTDGEETFGVPNNLYIIGTMNSADRSIALIDTALRRRFTFFEYTADSSLLSLNIEGINIQELVAIMNNRIEFLLDKDHLLGHAYFIHVQSKDDLCAVFRNKIIPLLEEYFYGDYEKIQLVLGDNKEFGKSDENKIVIERQTSEQKKFFGKEIDGFEEKVLYKINENILNENYKEITSEFFTSIYSKKIKEV